MPYLNFMGWFEAHFDNFSRERSIGNSPSFGICYRARNFQSFPIEDSSIANLREGVPISYELNSQDDSSHDLGFITSLNSKLKKILEKGSTENYHFGIQLVPIIFDPSNPPEEFKEDIPTSLYVFAGMTKEFYQQNQNRVKERKSMDEIAASIILWGLKNDKNPLEVIFNYRLEEAPNELIRKLRGKELDDFIKLHSSEDQ